MLWWCVCVQAELPPLRAELAAAGLAARRLSGLRFTAAKASHLARHRSLALALDTAPLYGGHTRCSLATSPRLASLARRFPLHRRSAADALLAGVPLLTLAAEAWSSRVAASIALAVGAPNLVASSHREWLHLARALLEPPARGARGLATGRVSGPLAAVSRPVHRWDAPVAAALRLHAHGTPSDGPFARILRGKRRRREG